MANTSGNAARTSTRTPLSFFRSLKIARKLLAGFLVLIALMVTVGGLSLSKMSEMNDRLDRIYHNRLVAVDTLGRVEARFEAMRFRVLDYAVAATPQARAPIAARIAELDGLLDEALATFTEVSASEDHTGYEQIIEQLGTYRQIRDGQLIPLANAGRLAEFIELRDAQVTPVAVAVAEALNIQIAALNEGARHSLGDAEAAYASSRALVVGAIVAGAALGPLMSFGLGWMISRQLGRTVAVQEGMAASVETAPLLHRLADIGCDPVQGYAYAPPLHRAASEGSTTDRASGLSRPIVIRTSVAGTMTVSHVPPA